MLDTLGSEVSQKIRQAIKAKLVELSSYVDDELPDYIMVMVANQKTPEDMKKDLSLFLNDNTDQFVTWLSKVLDKLKKVTLGEGKKKKAIKAKKVKAPLKKAKDKKGSPFQKSKTSTSTERSKRSPSSSRSSSPSPRRRKSPTRSHDRPRRVSQNAPRSRSRSFDRDRGRRAWQGERRIRSPIRSRDDSRGRSKSGQTRDRSRERRPAVASSIGAVIQRDPEPEDYDPEAMLKRSLVASQVKVTSRPSRPMEANKHLLMKAVADADKSIQRRDRESKHRDHDLASVRQKRMELSQARREGKLNRDKVSQINENIARRRRKRVEDSKSPDKPTDSDSSQESLQDSDLRHYLGPNKRPFEKLKIRIKNERAVREDDNDDDILLEEMRRKALESMKRNQLNRSDLTETYVPRPPEKKIIIPLNADDSSDEEDEVHKGETPKSNRDDCVTEVNKKQTTFIVTMGGIDESYFKSSKSKAKVSSVSNPVVQKDESKVNQPLTTPSPKKPEAKVAPLRQEIKAPLVNAKKRSMMPVSITSSKDKDHPDAAKPKRARITAPEPERVPIQTIMTTNVVRQKKEVCRYFPKCTRGDKCFYLHPAPKPQPSGVSKYSWTSASIYP